MVQKDLIEGIRIAISKGSTLKQAMISFYNSGYSKEEIIEAARIIKYEKFGTDTPQNTSPIQKPILKQENSEEQIQAENRGYSNSFMGTQIREANSIKTNNLSEYSQGRNYLYEQPKQIQQTQQISAYGTKEQVYSKKSDNALIILLIIFILIIGGIVIELFLFKEQISDFFNNLF